jgi:hypothetical protein
VRVGLPHGGGVSLAAVADGERLEALLPCGAPAERRRAGAAILLRVLTVVHQALLAPLAVDGMVLSAAATDVGYLLTPAGEVTVWADHWDLSRHGDPVAAVAREIARLLDPIRGALGGASGLPRTYISRRVVDQLTARGERLARRFPDRLEPGWPARLVDLTDVESPSRVRRMMIDPDGAGPIRWVRPRVCCAVTGPADPGTSCPTCPLLPDDRVRAERTRSWLAGLDDEQFLDHVGWSRR